MPRVPAGTRDGTMPARSDVVTAAPLDRSDADVQALSDEAIRSAIDRYVAEQEVRVSRWKESRSTMNERPALFPAEDDNPLGLAIEFKPEIHVVGLGITIGSCFFGIPLAGIPVEERTVAFRPIVCARKPE